MPKIKPTCELGANEELVTFFVTKIEATLNIPPQKSSRYKVTGFPPDNEDIKDKLNSDDYRGKRMVVRVNGTSIGHSTIYSIKQEEDSESYVIVGQNVAKNLKRESISATFNESSSIFVTRQSINQIGNPNDDNIGGGVTRPQQYIGVNGNGNFNNPPTPITQTVEDKAVDQLIEQTCNKNGWIWWINPRNHVCFGEASEAYAVGESDSENSRRGLLKHNLHNVLEMSPGLQQPAWNQVVVYGGDERTTESNTRYDRQVKKQLNQGRDTTTGIVPDIVFETVDDILQPDEGGEGEERDAEDGQNPDGSDTNSGPESNMSASPVIGRAYVKEAPEGEGTQSAQDQPAGSIIKGDPPGSETGGDLDEDDSGDTTDEAEEIQEEVENEEANQGTQISKEIAGPKPVYKWPDQTVHTQREADALAASILRSFYTKRRNGKITIPGRSEVSPMDIVTLPGPKPGTAGDGVPENDLKEPDLGGQSFLVTSVSHTLKEDGPWKTEIGVGGIIDGFVNGRSTEDDSDGQDGNGNDGQGSDDTSDSPNASNPN